MSVYNCAIIRGGTSKGIYLLADELPSGAKNRDYVISRLFGSPEIRQVNGLGGGDPLTSKVALLGAPTNELADINYLSGEVRLGSYEINYGIMCGNLASGVGIAAYHLGLLSGNPPSNTISVFNENSGSLIKLCYDNLDAALKGEESQVELSFGTRGGAITNKVFPTGHKKNLINIDNRAINYTVVDAGVIYVFVLASEVGLLGSESPSEVNLLVSLRSLVEKLRRAVCDMINSRTNLTSSLLPGQVKVAILSPVAESGTDSRLRGLIVNPQGAHFAYAVSGAIATCAASAIVGTIVSELVEVDSKNPELTIVHAEGELNIGANLEWQGEDVRHITARLKRTSRLIMLGKTYSGLDT